MWSKPGRKRNPSIGRQVDFLQKSMVLLKAKIQEAKFTYPQSQDTQVQEFNAEIEHF